MEGKISDWMWRRMCARMRQMRMEDKRIENQHKPPLCSPDVLYTADFVFTKWNDAENEGDSGSLLLAKRKSNRQERYLVKHAYCDCAANEFVYTKLGLAIGVKMPEAKLFCLSPGEKRSYFGTEYISGCRFLNVLSAHPSYQEIREKAKNWQDYFKFQAMEWMFVEGDGIELLLAEDGYVYRVDTTASFAIGEFTFEHAGVNQTFGGINLKERTKKELSAVSFGELWKYVDFHEILKELVSKYSGECIAAFLDPFYRIQEIKEDEIDGILNTLCYFYPDYIGDYYRCFIHALQKESARFLGER